MKVIQKMVNKLPDSGRLFWGRLGIFPEFDMVMAHPRGVSWA